MEDSNAINFAEVFYGSLVQGKTIEDAFATAKAVVCKNPKSKPNSLVICNQIPVALGENVLFKTPTLIAKFMENGRGKPARNGKCYEMEIWVENIPDEIVSVVYDFNDESLEGEDRFAEEFNRDYGAKTTATLYGDVEIRATLWSKNNGLGIVGTLYKSLERYYQKNTKTKYIRDALKNIKKN